MFLVPLKTRDQTFRPLCMLALMHMPKKIFRIRIFKTHLQFPTKTVLINEHYFTYKRSKQLVNMCTVFYNCEFESELQLSYFNLN